MKRFFVLILLLVVQLSGCGPKVYRGRIQVQDPNGTVLKQYAIETNAPMSMEVIEGETTISSDSRTPGFIESVALNLGLYKGDSLYGGY